MSETVQPASEEECWAHVLSRPPVAPPSWMEFEDVADPIAWAVPGVDIVRQPTRNERIERLREAVTAFERPSGLSGQAFLGETADLLRLIQQLRVVGADHLGQVQKQGLHELDAAGSAKVWALRISPDLPKGDLTLGRELFAWPQLSSAVHAGVVGLGAATAVGRALTKAAPHLGSQGRPIDGVDGDLVLAALARNAVQLVAQCTLGLDDVQLTGLTTRLLGLAEMPQQIDQLEGIFVLMAEHLSARVLPSCLAQQLDALLPSELEERAEEAHDRRFLEIRQHPHGEGMRTVIESDIETSELLHTCLAAAARRDPENPGDTAAWERFRTAESNDEATPLRPRSRGQRLHDALVRILEHYRDTGAVGSHDKMPVRITVTVPAGLVDGQPGALPALGASGQRLPASLIRRWWCNAEVTALLMSRSWRALGDTHTQRTLTGRERRALNVQDRRLCARDGCCDPDDPLTTYEPHHVWRWSDTGQTSLSDTILACPSLHHDLHHGRTVQLRDGRRITEQGVVSG